MTLLNRAFLFLCLISEPALSMEIGGQAKAYGIVTKLQGEQIRALWASSRLDISQRVNDKVLVQVSYELSLQNSSQSIANPADQGMAYRFIDKQDIYQSEDKRDSIYQNLDRFSVSYTDDKQKLVIGRQAIWFGVGRIANPTDVFVPYRFGQINPEYRIGVDGIRYTLSLGDLSEFEFGALWGHDGKPDLGAQFVRGRSAFGAWDLELLAISFLKAELIGLNVQTNVMGMGIALEGSHTKPEGDESYSQASLGLSYMLPSEWLVNVEGYYNQAGERKEAYYNSFDKFAYQKGGVAYLGRSYVSLGGSKALHPLWTLAADLIYNLIDRSSYLVSSLAHSLSDNSSLNFGVTGSLGSDDSEFGQVPQQYYINTSYYF